MPKLSIEKRQNTNINLGSDFAENWKHCIGIFNVTSMRFAVVVFGLVLLVNTFLHHTVACSTKWPFIKQNH